MSKIRSYCVCIYMFIYKLAITLIYACSGMTWELLYKVGEDIIFQIFILIYINHTKYEITSTFRMFIIHFQDTKNNKNVESFMASLSFHDTENVHFINYDDN